MMNLRSEGSLPGDGDGEEEEEEEEEEDEDDEDVVYDYYIEEEAISMITFWGGSSRIGRSGRRAPPTADTMMNEKTKLGIK
ncbi:hypothetical protein RUM44_012324 [Polyplax serrata]|uniref:Uncharacterized protein n=1 Tax=Polyplax serrata TaxID=468196 RepID=A0ABR1BFW5_POLSC